MEAQTYSRGTAPGKTHDVLPVGAPSGVSQEQAAELSRQVNARQVNARQVNGQIVPRAAQTAGDVLHEVHSAEDSYHGTEWASDQTQANLKRALADVTQFCNSHPDEAGGLIKKLESRDLIGQLAIAALQKASKEKHSPDELTKSDALRLLDGQGPLAQAFRNHIDKSFSVTPDSTHFGTGYADGVRRPNGKSYLGSPESESDTPILTTRHLDELMSRFDHGPTYRGESQTSNETWVDKIFGKAADILGF